MTTSSEEILLQVPHVRYKKGDGTLYLMDQRIAWMMENRDTVSISHLYSDIKSMPYNNNNCSSRSYFVCSSSENISRR